MSFVLVNTTPGVRDTGVAERLATGASAAFTLRPALFGEGNDQRTLQNIATGTNIKLEDVVRLDALDRALFKGVVEELQHSLTSEEVTVSCLGADQYIDSQPWEAVNAYYNTPDIFCGYSFNEATIQDFIDEEYVDEVITWFTAIDIPPTVGPLPCPSVTTLKKGFMTVLQEVLAPYPYVKWVIEFDKTTAIFPVGKLILLDLRNPAATTDLQVGGQGSPVVSLSVNRTARECAKHVSIHARGRFVERFELATPNWDPAEERLLSAVGAPFLPTDTKRRMEAPMGDDGTIVIPTPYNEFVYDPKLWVQGTRSVTPPGVGVFDDLFRLWPGADYDINMETGEVRFLKPEDGEQWWWVNRETGVVSSEVRNIFGGWAGPEAAQLRRPVAFNNAHIEEGVSYRFETTYMGENPYRKYKVSKPIADFRIRTYEESIRDPVTNLLTGETRTAIRRESESITAYIPKIAAQGRFEIEVRASQTMDIGFSPEGIEADFIGDPGTAEQTNWNNLFGQFNNLLKTVDERVDPASIEESDVPLIKAHLLWPRLASDPTQQEVLAYFNEAGSSVSFEEGTVCVTLAERQLLAQPLWYDLAKENASVGENTTTDPIRADWFSWPVLIRYTSWEDVVEERTTLFGGERFYRGVVNSAFIYEDHTEGDESVTRYNTINPDGGHQLEDIADDAADWFGTPYWTGTVVVHIEWDLVTSTWVIPYNVGDRITLSGEVNADLLVGGAQQFDGVITQVAIDTEAFTATLTFGRREPKTNPFLARVGYPVDIEGDSLTGEGKAGLSPLGGSQ